MKNQHIQEMDAWTDDESPAPDFRFFQGLLVGIPLGVALWTAIILWIW